MTRMSKEELAELQSPETWGDTEETVQRATKPSRAVVSVAFSREDFETIAESARQQGMKTSEFIRRSALEKAAPSQSGARVVSVSGGVYTGYTIVSAPRARTEVTTKPEPAVYATA